MDVISMNELLERVERRSLLLKEIQEVYPDQEGAVLLCAGFERDRETFYQESTFEYFLGLQEPALIAYQPLDSLMALYVPAYSIDRSVWVNEAFDEEHLATLAIEQVKLLGKPRPGYASELFFSKESVENLCQALAVECQKGNKVFIPLEIGSHDVRIVIDQLCQYVPGLREAIVDISPLVAGLRRTKSELELEYLYRAAEITCMAQQAAAGVIQVGNFESDVQAAIEYVFTESGATRAFTSIVGSGKNGTVLHYNDNKAALTKNSLVVVDIGASYSHYCSDVTRTYPVSGVFTARQKKVYQDVLDCHMYVADLAKPGMFISNKENPEKCLNTLAHRFLADRGYDVQKVFPHGVGHFVGLDVHDVGDAKKPLAVGDIITIEPGIYLRDEELGVRLEDVYWIVKDGAVCLTDEVPKKIDELLNFMKASRLGEAFEHEKTGPDEH